eukprot:m.72221 g.72221  ORF g.72221 m.72221 type:complete len:166 (+) comp35788_c0_seq2:166-663(+)
MTTLAEETLLLAQRVLQRDAGLDSGDRDYLVWNTETVPIIQEGPTCGIVALCSACQSLSANPQERPSKSSKFTDSSNCLELLQLARELGYTRHGEMFSVYHLSDLAAKYFRCKAEIVSCPLRDPKKLIEEMLCGKIYLIPYDKDKNNEPCLMGGHKAHWAILVYP